MPDVHQSIDDLARNIASVAVIELRDITPENYDRCFEHLAASIRSMLGSQVLREQDGPGK